MKKGVWQGAVLTEGRFYIGARRLLGIKDWNHIPYEWPPPENAAGNPVGDMVYDSSGYPVYGSPF